MEKSRSQQLGMKRKTTHISSAKAKSSFWVCWDYFNLFWIAVSILSIGFDEVIVAVVMQFPFEQVWPKLHPPQSNILPQPLFQLPHPFPSWEQILGVHVIFSSIAVSILSNGVVDKQIPVLMSHVLPVGHICNLCMQEPIFESQESSVHLFPSSQFTFLHLSINSQFPVCLLQEYPVKQVFWIFLHWPTSDLHVSTVQRLLSLQLISLHLSLAHPATKRI